MKHKEHFVFIETSNSFHFNLFQTITQSDDISSDEI